MGRFRVQNGTRIIWYFPTDASTSGLSHRCLKSYDGHHCHLFVDNIGDAWHAWHTWDAWAYPWAMHTLNFGFLSDPEELVRATIHIILLCLSVSRSLTTVHSHVDSRAKGTSSFRVWSECGSVEWQWLGSTIGTIGGTAGVPDPNVGYMAVFSPHETLPCTSHVVLR